MANNFYIDLPVEGGGGGSGTVTSVGFTATPSGIFDVSGSPVTTSGTIALSMDNQSANVVLAGPTTGAATTPSFRALVAADIPSLSSVYLPLAGGTMSGAISAGGFPSVNPVTRQLFDDAGNATVNWSTNNGFFLTANFPGTGDGSQDTFLGVNLDGTLIPTGIPSNNFNNYLPIAGGDMNGAITYGGVAAVDVPNRNLVDAANALSIDWNLRQLYADDGTTAVINWSTASAGLTANHFSGVDNGTTAAAGPAAGTGPTIILNGTDVAGRISVLTGSSPASDDIIVTITFANTYAPNSYYVVFSPINQNAAAISGGKSVYVDTDTDAFSFKSGVTSLTASTGYEWSYHVFGKE